MSNRVQNLHNKSFIIQLISIGVIVVSSTALVISNSGTFSGVEFEIYINQYLFSFLNFVVLMICIQKRERSLFSEAGIISLTRMNSRKKAFWNETAKLTELVFLFVTAEAFIYTISALITKSKINISEIILFTVCNFLVKLFFTVTEQALELKWLNDFIYIFASLFYLFLLYIAKMMKDLCKIFKNEELIKTLTFFNKINIVNFTSIPRINELGLSNIYIFTILAILIFISFIILFAVWKKADILRSGK